jgi:hypothetical protein
MVMDDKLLIKKYQLEIAELKKQLTDLVDTKMYAGPHFPSHVSLSNEFSLKHA